MSDTGRHANSHPAALTPPSRSLDIARAEIDRLQTIIRRARYGPQLTTDNAAHALEQTLRILDEADQ